MNWYLKCFKQYADFKGRARRTEFWMFTLINFVIAIILGVISIMLGIRYPYIDEIYYQRFNLLPINQNPLSQLFSLIVFIPSLAVSVRRLHDIGKSGWYIFVPILVPFILSFLVTLINIFLVPIIPIFFVILIPILGLIYLTYLYAKEGESGSNQYGEDPKKVDFE